MYIASGQRWSEPDRLALHYQVPGDAGGKVERRSQAKDGCEAKFGGRQGACDEVGRKPYEGGCTVGDRQQLPSILGRYILNKQTE